MKARRFPRWCAVLAVLVLFLWPGRAPAYSLLTHEQLIDLTWSDSIVPLLLSRYPNLTPAELETARAYAYGGCVIQDIGYYPFGHASFSNLTHYVRSGDFVVNLFRNAGNANELAFAVGALSHYIGDAEGHSQATNLAVPVEFPKLGKKYGKVVNYAQGEHEHVQTEFAFDINELSHGRMAPFRYQQHVGLEVPLHQLALAYYQTYGLTEDFSGTRGRRINVGAYRFAVRAFIPRIAYAVNILHRKAEPPDSDSTEAVNLRKEEARVAVENHWVKYQRKPGPGTYALAAVIFVLPKVGPLKLAAVKGPTVATKDQYVHSVLNTTGALRGLLARFTPPPPTLSTAREAAAADGGPVPPSSRTVQDSSEGKHATPREGRDPRHPLKNRDLDTGNVVQPGGYSLTDATYADLLHQIVQSPTQAIPPGIKEDILAFYVDLNRDFTTKKDAQQWKQVLADLETLKGIKTSDEPKPFPTYGDDTDDSQ